MRPPYGRLRVFAFAGTEGPERKGATLMLGRSAVGERAAAVRLEGGLPDAPAVIHLVPVLTRPLADPVGLLAA